VIQALSGKLSNLYFRRLRTITFLVKPPCEFPVPSAKQVAHRLAWWRSDMLRLALPAIYNSTLLVLANRQERGRRESWLHDHVSAESADGYAPTIIASDLYPPVENLTSIGSPFPGHIWLTYDVPPGAAFLSTGFTIRKVDAPGQPANVPYTQAPFPVAPAADGQLAIVGLEPATLYSFSVHFMHTLTEQFGPSSFLTEITSAS